MTTKTKTTTTNEEARLALVPKLRFPEFRDAVGWEISELGSLSDVRDGTHDSPEFFTTGWPLVTSKNLRPDGTLDLENVSLISEEDYVQINKRSKVSVGDILFGMIGTIGNPVLLKSEGFAIKNVALIKEMKSLSNTFVIQLLQTEYVAAIFAVLNTGNSQKFIALGKIRGLLVPVPSPAEQQKIAECLSSVDELMAAQARKVDALKTHKKGLMQQLFPREGETQPRLRFPEFQNAGEWVMKTMGSIASFSSGGTPSKDNPEYWNGTIPWVSASSMYDLVIQKADHYVTPLAIGNGTRIAKKGSILILVRGSMLFKRVPICVAGIDVTFNQDVKALDVDPSINTGFLLYQLSAFQARFPINETGIGAGKIELDHLKGFELFIPDAPEQEHIASCLSSLDALITAETQKHEALKTHKKGLMQQLFPAPTEQAHTSEGQRPGLFPSPEEVVV